MKDLRSKGDRSLSLGLGLSLTIGIAGLAYSRRRSSTETVSAQPITERHATAFLVSRRIDPDRVEAVTDHVADVLTGADSDRLLGIDGASTASLFLDRSENEPALCWYVELPRSIVDGWNDPESVVAEAFPIAHDALSPIDESVDRELVVHGVHPSRPRSLADCSPAAESGAVRSGEDGQGPDLDIVLVRLRINAGLPERFADWFAGITRRVVAGDLDLDRIESWSVEMLEAEEMYTESLFLERRADGYTLAQYMEARDMEAVYDAYHDTWNPVARVAQLLGGWFFEDPPRILQYPIETEIELLAHAIDPDRPRRVADCPGA